MTKTKRYIDSTLKFLYRNKVLDIPKVWLKYFKDLKQLKKTQDDDEFIISPDYPCLADNTSSSGEFGRYIYQDSWAFQHILSKKPKKLVDIASSTYFVAFAAQVTLVESVDIRLLHTSMKTIKSKIGDATSLPYKNNSVKALSSLSVIEHIGLGRYGDKVDYNGMQKAIDEIKRVLATNGMVLVAFPVGKTNKVIFNAHRICTPEKVYTMFKDLKLIDEKYALSNKIISKKDYDKIGRPYSYGCYYFTK
tara:strand:- start:64 stop:810 length:747 start_codon:yes stop_codon:yes gene_type:complete